MRSLYMNSFVSFATSIILYVDNSTQFTCIIFILCILRNAKVKYIRQCKVELQFLRETYSFRYVITTNDRILLKSSSITNYCRIKSGRSFKYTVVKRSMKSADALKYVILLKTCTRII